MCQGLRKWAEQKPGRAPGFLPTLDKSLLKQTRQEKQTIDGEGYLHRVITGFDLRMPAQPLRAELRRPASPHPKRWQEKPKTGKLNYHPHLIHGGKKSDKTVQTFKPERRIYDARQRRIIMTFDMDRPT